MKIAIQTREGREGSAVFSACNYLDYEYTVGQIDLDAMPVGSVDWVQNWLGPVIPYYYPVSLHHWLKRKVFYCCHENELPLFENYWVKPAHQYKKFDAVVGATKEHLPFYGSQHIPNITSEHRLYVVSGELLEAWPYIGDEETIPDELISDLKASNLTGAIDFAYNGEWFLMEAHHPFAIGWYGEDPLVYLHFLVEGWKSMNYQSTLD